MSEPRPNILLITTDQQRGDCIAIDENAPPCLQTPNLDALGAGGARFRRAYSECPSCIPARRSLMTGMAPAAQGMVGMTSSDWQPPHTLAGELRQAGYQTHLVGKLHLQPAGARFGFDSMEWSDGPVYPSERRDAYVRWLRDVHGRREFDAVEAHGHDPNGWDAGPGHLPIEQTYSYWCVSQAVDFLEYRRDPTCSFFLNLSLFDPHPPIVPPESYWNRYINEDLPEPVVGDWAESWDAPKKGLETSAWRIHIDRRAMRNCRAGYYATIHFLDDQIGRLLQYLRRNHNLIKNTVVLFTSDHGEMLGDHHLYRKCRAYEGSARVPLLLRLPDPMGGMAGVVADTPVGLQDVMPTLLEAAGVPIPAACTGKSLLATARGERAAIRDVLHGEHHGQYEYDDGMHYLVDERYKYVWYSQREQEHLFDLANDPHEQHDLSRDADSEPMLARWRARLTEFLRDRKEGFVQDGRLTRGAPHKALIPDYRPDRFFPYDR